MSTQVAFPKPQMFSGWSLIYMQQVDVICSSPHVRRIIPTTSPRRLGIGGEIRNAINSVTVPLSIQSIFKTWYNMSMYMFTYILNEYEQKKSCEADWQILLVTVNLSVHPGFCSRNSPWSGPSLKPPCFEGMKWNIFWNGNRFELVIGHMSLICHYNWLLVVMKLVP